MNPAKRSFVFPAGVTFALFALLLVLGSRRPAALARVAAPLPAAAPRPPTVTLTDPVEVENSEAGPAARGPVAPVLPEPPAVPDPTGISIAPPPVTAPDDRRDLVRLPAHWGSPLGPGGDSGRGIMTATMLDSLPRAVAQAAPAYPYAAKEAGRSGQVTVEFWVDAKGLVHDPRAVSSTAAEFEEPALRAVARWRFEPGRQNGRVVSFRMAVPVKFTLESSP
jgi:protein TonB